MHIVTVVNYKGGVGKTTTAFNLGAGLRAKGYKTLLIDLDPQTNLSFVAGVDLTESDYRLYNVVKGRQKVEECIYQIEDDLEDFDIIVGGADFLKAEPKTTDLLKKALDNLADSYDYVVIDSPPSLNKLTQNAIVASNDLIIPLRADIFSLQGLGGIQGIINECNPDITISGLLMIGVSERTNLSKLLMDVFKQEAKKLNTKVFTTTIRNSVKVPESQVSKMSLYKYAPSARVTKDFESFVDEYIKGVKKNGRKKAAKRSK